MVREELEVQRTWRKSWFWTYAMVIIFTLAACSLLHSTNVHCVLDSFLIWLCINNFMPASDYLGCFCLLGITTFTTLFFMFLQRQYTQKSYSSPSEIYADKSSLYKWCRVWVGCGSFWRICTSRGGVFQKHRVWSIRYNGMGNLLALFKYTACWVVSDKAIGGLTLWRLDNAFQPSQLELKFNLCLITTGMFFMCSWCMKCIKSAICPWEYLRILLWSW